MQQEFDWIAIFILKLDNLQESCPANWSLIEEIRNLGLSIFSLDFKIILNKFLQLGYILFFRHKFPDFS